MDALKYSHASEPASPARAAMARLRRSGDGRRNARATPRPAPTRSRSESRIIVIESEFVGGPHLGSSEIFTDRRAQGPAAPRRAQGPAAPQARLGRRRPWHPKNHTHYHTQKQGRPASHSSLRRLSSELKVLKVQRRKHTTGPIRYRKIQVNTEPRRQSEPPRPRAAAHPRGRATRDYPT